VSTKERHPPFTDVAMLGSDGTQSMTAWTTVEVVGEAGIMEGKLLQAGKPRNISWRGNRTAFHANPGHPQHCK
jgi:hypothetical protein